MTERLPSHAVAARIERQIPGPPEAVYRAFTEPVTMARWLSPVGHAEVEADVRVGGALRVAMIEGEVRIDHAGKFLELEPPRRLVFTWSSPYTGAEPSVVTVELHASGVGTRLVLTHERLPEPVLKAHEGGWRTMVARLAALMGETNAEEEVQPR